MNKINVNSRPRAEWEYLIGQWVHDERDRWLLSRKLLDGLTYDELTDAFQAVHPARPLEKSQVYRRCKAAERQLADKIK